MLRAWARRIPGAAYIYHRFGDARLRRRSPEDVFSEIYVRNSWGDPESASGPGSSLAQTQVVAAALPNMFRSLAIRSMLDVPCGDFNWMQRVDLEDIQYVGADIVPGIVIRNLSRFGGPGREFRQLDLLKDRLPASDLVLCRDCLVHFSYQDAFRVLQNICDSESKYLLTTTFTDRTSNSDIATGRWRPVNLEIAPFGLPTPLEVINEKCTIADGAFADKALALWRVADIRDRLAVTLSLG